MTALLKALDVLPGWAWALLCSGAIASQAVSGYQLKTERLAHQTTKATYAAQVAAAEQSTRIESEKNRAIEQELSRAQETHAQEIATLRIHRDRDRIAAGAVADRLRNAARATATLAGEACADSSSAELREAAAHAARVLADVREQVDYHAGILARTADDAHFAGSACERTYDAAREALKD